MYNPGMYRNFATRTSNGPVSRLQSVVTGLPTWGSGQPGQVGNQAALTVEPVLGSRLVT